jgi:hypothetical protein
MRSSRPAWAHDEGGDVIGARCAGDVGVAVGDVRGEVEGISGIQVEDLIADGELHATGLE